MEVDLTQVTADNYLYIIATGLILGGSGLLIWFVKAVMNNVSSLISQNHNDLKSDMIEIKSDIKTLTHQNGNQDIKIACLETRVDNLENK